MQCTTIVNPNWEDDSSPVPQVNTCADCDPSVYISGVVPSSRRTLCTRSLDLRCFVSSSSSSSSFGGGSGLARLLRVQHGLQLGRSLEASVIRVLLVEVVVRLGSQLGGQVVEDALEDAVDRLLLVRLSVPYRDEVRVEAYGEPNAANLVACWFI